MTKWSMIKSDFLEMTVDEKREYYKCGEDFLTLSDIVDWGTYGKSDEAKAKLTVVGDHSPKKDASIEETSSSEIEKINTSETVVGDHSPKKDDSIEKTSSSEIEKTNTSKIEKTNADEVKAEPLVTDEIIPKTESSKVDEETADAPMNAETSVTSENVPKSDDGISTQNPNAEENIADPPVTVVVTNFRKNDVLNGKISMFTGDITCLEIDVIVNAANSHLDCGGGVDYAIHSAAGHAMLKAECRYLGGCDPGDAKITGGYMLPAKYIIHAVGPKGEYPEILSSCYKTAMDLMKEHKLETIAFPCISTGIYGYPNENAAAVALETIRKWLDTDEYSVNVKRVIFCLFLDVDIKIYEKLLPKYFPL